MLVGMLQVLGLSCLRNDQTLFSGLTFNLLPGQAMQIQAANGVGKSTLLKIIAKLYPLSAGKIEFSDKLIYLGHKSNLHPALSPYANLKFLCAIDANVSVMLEANLQAALSFAGLSAQQDVPCEELSAGQCQRINLARLYLTAAKLWLLDEPFTHLDTAAKNLLLNLCRKHLAVAGMILLATHSEIECSALEANTLYLESYACNG